MLIGAGGRYLREMAFFFPSVLPVPAQPNRPTDIQTERKAVRY